MKYGDKTSRLGKMGDALSQLVNVSFGRNHKSTSANESISGRAHRQGQRKEWWIDRFFWWQRNPRHCEAAYLNDLERAKAYIAAHDMRGET